MKRVGFVYCFTASLICAAAPLAPYTSPTGIEFILIPPGRMQIAVFQPVCPSESDPAVVSKPGSNLDPHILWTAADLALCQKLIAQDSSPGFPVAVSKAFYMGRFEITQAEWTKVMGRNPSVFQGSQLTDDASRHPVENVTWKDAQAFVRELNRLEHTHAYRVPTEFEWEYAGRAGGPGQVGWDAIRRQAVQGLRAKPGGPPPTTQPIGSKDPNAWGLYDMLGNVWEWVQDGYNERTFPDPAPPAHASQHVLKGGGFLSDVKNTIYATHAAGPADRWDVGFRIVKDVEP